MEPERERFETMFREHFDVILRYALARADRDEALEATADTFVVAWRRCRDIPERSLPWLLAVTRRTLADRRRSSRRRFRLAERVVLYRLGELTAPDLADEVAYRDVLLGALRQLSDADREVLELVAWDGLTPADAATVVDCSPATFNVRLWRARQRLEQAIKHLDDQRDAPRATKASQQEPCPVEEIR